MRLDVDPDHPIWKAWLNGKVLAGPDMKPHSRLTVEPGWRLRTTSVAGSRSSSKLPIRYFQRADNDQTEIEIPGLRDLQVDYDVDADVATLKASLVNNILDPDYGSAAWGDPNGDFGQPGALTPERGTADNPWGYVPNEWEGLLTRNSLLRSYEGYGGHGKGLAQCLEDGNLVQTGVWLVDDTPIQTGQVFELDARNMGKLLVDQQLFPPLVPAGDYPMSRARFYYVDVDTPQVIYGVHADNPLFRVLAMEGDATGDGYWLCGTDGGVFAYGLAPFEGSIDSLGITIAPGTYPSEGITGMARTASGKGYWLTKDNGAVYSFGDAEFHGSIDLGDAPAHPIVAIVRAGELDGYWLVGDDGGVFAFGDAGFYGSLPPLVAGAKIVDITSHPDGLGYAMADDQGHVYTYGSFAYQGGLATPPIGGPVVAIASSHTGDGYYLAGNDGGVFAFGDAVYRGSVPDLSPPITLSDPISDIVVDPAGTGYWLAGEDGGVITFNVSFFGSMPGAFGFEFPSDGNYCCDTETEALTKSGWRACDELLVGDELLSIDPATGLAAWHPVRSIFRRDVTDLPMVSMENSKHSSLTTPNHKWLVDHRDRGLEVRQTRELRGTMSIPRAANRSDSPERPFYSDDFVELVGWFWTEGCLADTATLSQSEKANPEYVKTIDECLHRLYGEPGPMRGQGVTSGVQFRHHWNRTTRSDGIVVFRLSAFIRWDLEKVMTPAKALRPDFLTWLTQSQLELLISTSIQADGNVRTDNGTVTIVQKDRSRIDSLEMACALAGVAFRSSDTGGCRYLGVHRDSWTGVASLTVTEDSYTGMIWCPTVGHGNWLARRRGTVYFTGNTDLTDIVKDIALYAGFHLYDGGVTDNVFGTIESTGIYTPDDGGNILDATFFDKLPVIDPMTKLKEVVGYLLMVDEEGALVFREPNFWGSGNWLPDDTHVATIPVVDERVHLTKYGVSKPDRDLRSEIIISSEDPDAEIAGTVTTRFTPATAAELRGLIRPAMWVNEVFIDSATQQIMAELIALQIYFKTRLGSVTCMANPLINVDDQVQILERETFEQNYHYVRRTSRQHDHKTGEYTMTLTTNVLSPPDGPWAVVKPDGSPSGSIVTNRVV